MDKKVRENCALPKALNLLGGKWKLAIIYQLLMCGTTRYNELKRQIDGISNTMLAKALKELESAGLIERKEYLEVPVRVEYNTTPLCNDLKAILINLEAWAKQLN